MSHFSGYGAYQLFLALRTHFTNSKYDFFQFHGKLNTKKESYLKRNDRFFFEKIAKEYDAENLRDFYIANFLKDYHYITELLDDGATQNFIEYKSRRQALTYNFTSELDRIFRHGITRPFVIVDGEYPYIVGLYLRGSISPETFAIVNDFIQFFPKYDRYFGDNDPIWSKVSLKIIKYKPFLKYDKDKYKSILKGKLNEQRETSEKI